MKRMLVLVALIATMMPGAVHANNRTHHVAQGPRPDPCGYRYAMWPQAQEVVDFVSSASTGDLSSFKANEIDTYLELKSVDIVVQHGEPAGSKNVGNAEISIRVYVQLAFAAKDKGDEAGFNSYMSQAGGTEKSMWKAISAMCPWRGKAKDWTGYFNVYGYQSKDAGPFRVPRNWTLIGDYQCPPDNYGGLETSPSNFIVYLHGGGGSSVAFNELKTDNLTYRTYQHSGTTRPRLSRGARGIFKQHVKGDSKTPNYMDRERIGSRQREAHMFRRKKPQVVVRMFKSFGIRGIQKKYAKDAKKVAEQGYVVESQSTFKERGTLLTKMHMLMVTYRLQEKAKR